MKLTILGTGNAMVTLCYNTCFALCEGEDFLLVDAGGGKYGKSAIAFGSNGGKQVGWDD